ncbi:substrate-binding domain-containing protein [Streptomyces sp. TLI_146]|uniref:substrate-binding domain-containing protein n=1 Tax=Streptomyces sp. TLI_146 TaxID=1938858 RepID=UPI000C712258|nr:substrate-binding domain-containing protein [Streptomyces sp. TLI_146]PKV84507.1 von Willebrand factor type A domain-containing protein [Streptomyces sp. TLI_146]
MGRHSLPDAYASEGTRGRPAAGRRRTVVVATLLVLVVAGGAAVAAGSGLLSFGDSCRDSAVRLDLVASPDVAPAVRSVAERARADKVTSDGSCIDVRVTARESYKVADALGAGRDPDFAVWIPDSALWVDRAKEGGDGVSVATAGHVAASPVALALVAPAAKSLGWPSRTYTWGELAAAATRSDALRLGAADPSRSAAGLLALSSIGRSTARQGADGSTKAAALAKLLSQRTSDTDAQVVDTLARDGSGTESGNPRRNQAVVLSEQAAYAYNTGRGAGRGLDLFYPKDGAPLLDYPYTIVRESRLSTDRSRAAMRFLTLLGEPESRRTLARSGFRTPGDAVDEAAVKKAGGTAPQPYATSSAEAPSAKELQEALGMWTIIVQSARLTTVVDASGSMAAPVPGAGGRTRMDVTKTSLLRALAQFTTEDEIGLWDFATRLDGSRDYRELVPTARLGDPVKGGRTQRERLAAAFGALQPVPDGATGLYDTALAAYQQATAGYRQGKFNALVILTDGANEDPGSISRGELITRLQKLADPAKPVPMIAIAVGPDADGEAVREIAKATGGAGYQVTDPAEIQAVILKAIMTVGQGGGAG